MVDRRTLMAAASGLVLALGASHGALAAEKLEVVASFSILGDMVAEIGGDTISVTTLVGPDGDAHVYEPTPSDARAVHDADLLVTNGLGFEGWLPRLVEAADFTGTEVVATDGIEPLRWSEPDDHGHEDEARAEGEAHEREEHAAHDHEAGHEGHHHHGEYDPHAWQSLENGVVYVNNIAAALQQADPANAELYARRAADYVDELEALDALLKETFDAIAPERRTVVTSHDAFRYLGDAYGIEFLAPEGISTEGEPSAADIARIIDQIKEHKIRAVFVENIADNRVIEQITRETGAEVGGALYSDALSGPDGPAPTYLDMFEFNASQLAGALGQS